MANGPVLPLQFDRKFSIHLFWISHGILLLRSGKTKQHPTRIDIVFKAVEWMALPTKFDGIRIEVGAVSEVPIPLTASVREDAKFCRVFKIISEQITHYVIADGIHVAEDNQEMFANSGLLKEFDLPALTAPLWKSGESSQ